MKKILICAGGLALSCGLAASAFAGAIDNKTNWSAEYIRTLNRNAATDFADIAAYNPAGTVKLHKGFTVNGSVQYLAKDYKNVINGTDFESDEPSFIPGIFGVYNTGKWALFAVFSNYGGGGKVDYSDGNFRTLAAGAKSLEAESHYLGYSFGGAFSINEMISVSVAARYIDALKNLKVVVPISATATTQVEYDDEADGWGAVFGVNIAPNEMLNIGIRYETQTDLGFKTKVKKDDFTLLPGFGVIDGQKVNRNLPSLLGLGASYHISPQLRAEANLTYYFNQDADWGGAEDLFNTGYDVGITLEYRFNDKLLGSIGYLYTELGADPENMLPENPELNANTLGAGVAYSFSEKLHGNFSIGNSFYLSDDFKPNAVTKVEYEKNIFFLALGVEYRF
ncbi:MAG: outer membrane protein transport protein [Deltaproteobacteria bacterium]|jgi:long-chain fatty acid transport protein|nr:outer membrane protein transport protein [Deltaproteobacteria bacterium]